MTIHPGINAEEYVVLDNVLVVIIFLLFHLFVPPYVLFVEFKTQFWLKFIKWYISE